VARSISPTAARSVLGGEREPLLRPASIRFQRPERECDTARPTCRARGPQDDLRVRARGSQRPDGRCSLGLGERPAQRRGYDADPPQSEQLHHPRGIGIDRQGHDRPGIVLHVQHARPLVHRALDVVARPRSIGRNEQDVAGRRRALGEEIDDGHGVEVTILDQRARPSASVAP
jgi:hypothetical protein